MTNPLHYEMVNERFPQPTSFPQQQYRPPPYLAPAQPRTLQNSASAWVSSNERAHPGRAQHAMHGTQNSGLNHAMNLTTAGTRQAVVNFHDCSIAKNLDQEAALSDRIATRLHGVLSRLDNEDSYDEDVDALARGFGDAKICDDASHQQHSASSKSVDEDTRSGIFNFKKTWDYANSRLPPQLLPFKVYMPTWQILCRAAEASASVYTRHRPNEKEKEGYIEADWRHGTKAMVFKSSAMDEHNLIVLSIRGSKWNLVDWAVNIKLAPTEPHGFLDDEGNACHAGFLQVARAMVGPVAARLRELLEQDPSRAGSSLVLTGHSAGGAVASLLYMHMLSSRFESELNILTGCFRRVHCAAFGAPPVSLLPLQKPDHRRFKKSLFFNFVNEGDPVVRAEKQYLLSVARLVATTGPSTSTSSTHPLKQKFSRQRLNIFQSQDKLSLRHTVSPPIWPVPEAILSNAGRLVLLRNKPGNRHSIEAVSISDEQLRGIVFGDPPMHSMVVYKHRIDDLAFAAVTGRSSG